MARTGAFSTLNVVSEQDAMSSIVPDLAKILPAIRRSGDFYAAGTAEMFAPNLEVDGVGRISLPLLPVQAQQLIAVASRAPYGRGKKPSSTPMFVAPGKSMRIASASAGVIGCKRSMPSLPKPLQVWA